MSWHAYRLTFRLESPLHAGVHKVGNLQRTRRYVPGQTISGAAVARLGAALDRTDPADFAALRDVTAADLLLGYFYPALDIGEPIVPWHHPARGLLYAVAPDRRGADVLYSPTQLDHLLVASWTSTAIASGGRTAKDGSLHEVEYLMARTRDGRQVYLTGLVYVREGAVAHFPGIAFRATVEDAWVETGTSLRALFGDLWRDVQIGGERKYGFGRVSLVAAVPLSDREFMGGATWPSVEITAGVPLPAHVDAASCPGVHGVVEPLVGRQTVNPDSFGQQITAARICWAPGSTHASPGRFEVRADGLLFYAGPAPAGTSAAS